MWDKFKLKIQFFLWERDWVTCDHAEGSPKACKKLIRPRWLAMRQGWICGGTAGWYDLCNEHKNLPSFMT